MQGFEKSFSANGKERGNAVIYVLIVIALFAALSFVLSRQSDTSEQGALSGERREVQVAEIIQRSNQIKQGLDQMIWAGTDIGDLDFILPSNAAFDTAPNIDKVFHPEGGGIVMPRIPPEAVHRVEDDPPPGWYLGRFSNVEWTESNATDVILVAHQISQPVCALINEKLTGSAAIPALTVELSEALIDTLAIGINNIDLDTSNCPDPDGGGPLEGCEGQAALCVSNPDGTMWGYYSIIAQR